MADDATILGLTLITAGSAAVKELSQSRFPIKPVIGGWFLGLFLLGIANVHKQTAIGLGALAAVTSVLINGDSLFAAIGSTLNPKPGTTAVPASYTQGGHQYLLSDYNVATLNAALANGLPSPATQQGYINAGGLVNPGMDLGSLAGGPTNLSGLANVQ